MKRFILSIIISMMFNQAYGQCENFKIDSLQYPGICLENIIKWLGQTHEEWSAEMHTFDFSATGNDEGSIFYSTSTKHVGMGIQFSIEKTYSMIVLLNSPISKKKEGFFASFIKEIEPYFTETKSNGTKYFIMKHSNGYRFEISFQEKANLDLIFIRNL